MANTRDKRLHGLDAAGAGDAGVVDAAEILGPCPSCKAVLRVGYVTIIGRLERVLIHPVPFCSYYGETDPSAIKRDIEFARGAS